MRTIMAILLILIVTGLDIYFFVSNFKGWRERVGAGSFIILLGLIWFLIAENPY